MNEINYFFDEGEKILSGKKDQLRFSLVNFLADGNTLIEDVPGVGKTTLVKFFSQIFDLNLSRIQFTNDLLPSDIIGTSVYNSKNQEFEFYKGPIFGDIILADELNRAPPKTQSALLQAMEEKHISIDGHTFQLPEFFHVIATQNPQSQVGTYDLPESQLDRFSMKFSIGYPDKESTIKMLAQKSLNQEIKIEKKISADWIRNAKLEIENILLSQSIKEYIYRLLETSRNESNLPLSNRCGIDLVKVGKAYAWLLGEKALLPEHIQYLFPYVSGHRLVSPEESDTSLEINIANNIIKKTSVR